MCEGSTLFGYPVAVSEEVPAPQEPIVFGPLAPEEPLWQLNEDTLRRLLGLAGFATDYIDAVVARGPGQIGLAPR